MKKIVLFAVLLTSILFSQTKLDSSAIPLKGKFAVSFSVSDLVDFSSLDGAFISGQYNFTNNSAVRFGFGMNNDNLDMDGSDFLGDSLISSKTGLTDFYSWTLNLFYQYRFAANDDLNLFFASGIYYSYGESTTEYTQNTTETQATRTKNDIGIPVILGVEWFVRNNISLFAEYGFDLEYTYDKRTTESICCDSDPNIGEETQIDRSVSARNVRLGISFFF